MPAPASSFDFLQSALTLENPFMPDEKFMKWLKDQQQVIKVNIDPIPFSELKNWSFEQHTGNLVHSSGKFFSIEGINIKTNWGKVSEWSQPIINQPEIGYLGIITKKFNGILYFLMQAKVEPGNINNVQLSPTLQATKSNYTQVHKGNSPFYLEYFNGTAKIKSKTLLDQLQSEQGARFLRKRNRNIIIEIEEDIPVYDNFCWLTLGQIKKFLQMNNVINMDTRTVLSGISFGDSRTLAIELVDKIKDIAGDYEAGLLHSMLDKDHYKNSIEDIISWITALKSKYELDVSRISLNKVKGWTKDAYAVFHEEKKYFSVIAVNVAIANREVTEWTQPLIKSAQEGIIAFIIKKINGIYHFLVQAKLEAGNFDIMELAPTVQCLTGNYRKGLNEYEVPFLDDVLNAKPEQVKYAAYQSEEGGRFFKEQNKNIIIEAREDFPTDHLPENYCWITMNQLMVFLKFNNYLNIEARSLISAARFI